MTMRGNSGNVAKGVATLATPATLPEHRWCILSTSGGRTLPLARSLCAAGLNAWAPVRTDRRPAPGQRRALHLGLRRRMIEVDAAILPGFVFVDAVHLDELARIVIEDALAHPPFVIFHLAGRAPLIGSDSIAGLREEEQRAAEFAQSLRDADRRAEARRIRAEFMRTEQQRRMVLRRERRDFEIGAKVEVVDMPSMAGMVGVVTKSNGTSAMIDFGGRYPMKVEAWQVIPVALQEGHAEKAPRP